MSSTLHKASLFLWLVYPSFLVGLLAQMSLCPLYLCPNERASCSPGLNLTFMQTPPLALQVLYQAALEYEEQGDHYQAVKLYRRVIKDAPQWALPFLRLGSIYKSRREWKPTFHYNKKAVALAVEAQHAWLDMGIAAVALGKTRVAHRVWDKFGWAAQRWGQPVSLRLLYDQQFEIVGAVRTGPAAAIIKSIPNPASDYRYHDVVLLDHQVQGYHSNGFQRLSVYDCLGLLRTSAYDTCSCVLHEVGAKQVASLREMCQTREMGFELWSNAAQSYTVQHSDDLPEYHAFPQQQQESCWAALAARQSQQILEVLQAWSVIHLKSYSEFTTY